MNVQYLPKIRSIGIELLHDWNCNHA